MRFHWTLTCGGSLAASMLASGLGGCGDQSASHDQSTPDATIAAARSMLAEGEAERLVELIHAETPEMRRLINQMGVLLGSVQDLALATRNRFPDEVEQLRAEAQQAALEGRASSFATLLVGLRPVARGDANFGVGRVRGEGLRLEGAEGAASPKADLFGGGGGGESQRRIFNALAKQVFADPYSWIDDQEGRLGTVYVSDERVALTWDDRPILPPIGLTMLLGADARWRLELPTSLPFVRQALPQNETEYEVFGMIFKTIDNVVNDLVNQVEGGGVNSLTSLSDTAVEKAALPAVMIFVAYGNLVANRQEFAGAAADAEPDTEPEPETLADDTAAEPGGESAEETADGSASSDGADASAPTEG